MRTELYFLNETIRTNYPEVLLTSLQNNVLTLKDFRKMTEYTINLVNNEVKAKTFGGGIEADLSNETLSEVLKIAFEVKKAA